ncbi:MAG: CopG family transcriptional regulator [Actinomycetota bacterium]|nr:CopG family transcriptional regulator [Actinomycetota bacterium]
MKKQLIVRIDEKLKNKFSKIARIEGKTTSEKVRELVSSYTAENDFAAVVDNLWDGISEKIERSGFKPEDIDKKIKETRRRKR